jgi:hypothetical protein
VITRRAARTAAAAVMLALVLAGSAMSSCGGPQLAPAAPALSSVPAAPAPSPVPFTGTLPTYQPGQ